MKIALFGATGKIGRALLETLGGEQRIVFAPTRTVIDLSTATYADIKESMRLFRPELMINAAAFNGMESCEENFALAHKVNTLAPAIMARVCSEQRVSQGIGVF